MFFNSLLEMQAQGFQRRLAVEAGEVFFRGDPLHLADRPAGLGGAAGELLGPGVAVHLRHGAAVVDTSNLNMHQLKAIIQDRYGGTGKLAVTLVSFGMVQYLPTDAPQGGRSIEPELFPPIHV